MKVSTVALALWGGMGVLAAPVDPPAESNFLTKHPEIYSELVSNIFHPHSRSHSLSNSTSVTGKDKVRTKTKTVTEDCTATDEVSSTKVIEHPTTIVTKTVIRVDLVSSKSLHKPKHTKHHWTETEVETETETFESPSSKTFESSKTHSKHHKSKHHTKHHSSETVETPLPTTVVSSSQVLSETPVEEVIVTTEEVEVITTGIEEVVSTITLSESSSTGSSTVAPWRTQDPLTVSPYVEPEWLPEFQEPHTPIWPDIMPPRQTFWTENEFPEETPATHTRSGHKTKEPPSIVDTASSSSTDGFIEQISKHFTITDDVETPSSSYGVWNSIITAAPEYPPTETFIEDDVLETLVALEAGDPDKERDKYLKPDKAMSKRMKHWSETHWDEEEKNWSRHLSHGVKSLEQRIDYDSKHAKKHKTTLAAVLPALESPVADAPALNARDMTAAAAGNPEKKYQKKMSVADKVMSKAEKVYSKFESFADDRYSKQHSKEMKKSRKKHDKEMAKSSKKAEKEYKKASKKREKSWEKEIKSEEKARSKAIKSRIKEQDEDDGYGVLEAREEELGVSTPVSVPARATARVTVTVMTTVGGPYQNGTISTSWRTKHATKTASGMTTRFY